ncbi:MAG: bifunctional nuclease family protein [Candidatus Eisenbacteria bacterium]
MIEVKVWSLALDDKNNFPVVILQSVDGSKKLPIWIGPPEANAIAMEIAGKRFPRPLSHDLIVAILKGLGAKVPRVEITDLRDNTFFAKIYLERMVRSSPWTRGSAIPWPSRSRARPRSSCTRSSSRTSSIELVQPDAEPDGTAPTKTA